MNSAGSSCSCVARPVADLIRQRAQVLDVALHHGGQSVGGGQVRGHLHPLPGGEAVADQLLQGPLQLRVARVAQGGRKAHHRGLADTDAFPQAVGGHEHRLVVVGFDVLRDLAVAFAQLLAAAVQLTDQILHAAHLPLPAAAPAGHNPDYR